MGFTSQVYRNEIVINDATPMEKIDPADAMKGYRPDLRSTPFGEIPGAEFPLPPELLVPRSEWQARIQEMEERKTRLSDSVTQSGLPHKDQGRTNYCWVNAPVACVEILRVRQNQKMVSLSPASVGAKVKNFQNVGGWGGEGLRFIAQYGVTPVDLWPANAIDRRYDTAEAANAATAYRVTEWMELKPKNLDEMVSLLMHRTSGAAGYLWWGHEVNLIDPVWLDGDIAIRIRNSWANWGDNGFGILQGSKMFADELVAPRVALAS